MKLITFKLVKL